MAVIVAHRSKQLLDGVGARFERSDDAATALVVEARDSRRLASSEAQARDLRGHEVPKKLWIEA
jgi:hypothetical protein